MIPGRNPREVHLLIVREESGSDLGVTGYTVCGHSKRSDRTWAVSPSEGLRMVEQQEQMFGRLNSLKFSRCPDCWNKDNLLTMVAIDALSEVSL